ncbi:zinc-ribbon domain-containing protein [Elioraea sp.]|uniref:zinc-ribbon domain-containing protein n=1 Tax=Elioraea sp. TaxID=2185103 RepID=UPI0021DDB6E5|nr:zinc-ribbon domain-containing protein [Elioraea sp.]GIX10782.1 MAG: hypothetical protein KatS3mg116_2492 [Elioraea sp.]
MPRIACPSCGARYDVAAGMIGPAGKSVRCARCGHVWLARAEGEVPAEPPAQWPEPPPPRVRDVTEEEPPRRRAAPSPPPPPAEQTVAAPPEPRARHGSGAAIAWALTLLVVGAAAYGALAYPQMVIEAWPASARLYAALGLIR